VTPVGDIVIPLGDAVYPPGEKLSYDSDILEAFDTSNQYELLSEASITDDEDSIWIPDFVNKPSSRRTHRSENQSHNISSFSQKTSRISVVINRGLDTSSTIYKQPNQVLIGKGPSSSVQAEFYKQKDVSDCSTDNTVTGVFVSRFKPQMTAARLDQYVRLHFGVNVKSEKLRTRFNSYSSFYIRADRKLREVLLNSQAEHIWSRGLLVRPYS
jgi:hypothetical protein